MAPITQSLPVTDAAAQLALAGHVIEVDPAVSVSGVHIALGAHGLAEAQAVELGEGGGDLLLGVLARGLRAPTGEHLVGVVPVVMVVMVLVAVLMLVIVAAGAALAVLVLMLMLVVMVMVVLVVMVVAAAALFVLVIVLNLGGEAVELGLQRVLALHGGAELPAVQLVPGGGDYDGGGVVLAEHCDALLQLALAHALGAAEDDGAGVFHLVAPELAEVLHIHPRARGVHHGGEAAGDEVAVAEILHGADDVAELADAAGLDEHAVRVVFGLDLLKGLGEVAHEAAADAAGAHLAYLDAGLLQKAAVNGYLAELVLYQHELFALIGLGDELLDERGLASAQKAGEYVDPGHKNAS